MVVVPAPVYTIRLTHLWSGRSMCRLCRAPRTTMAPLARPSATVAPGCRLASASERIGEKTERSAELLVRHGVRRSCELSPPGVLRGFAQVLFRFPFNFRSFIMKVARLTFALLLVSLMAARFGPGPGGGGRRGGGGGFMMGGGTATALDGLVRAAKRLDGITDEQKSQVHAVAKDYAAQFKALRDKSPGRPPTEQPEDRPCRSEEGYPRCCTGRSCAPVYQDSRRDGNG